MRGKGGVAQRVVEADLLTPFVDVLPHPEIEGGRFLCDEQRSRELRGPPDAHARLRSIQSLPTDTVTTGPSARRRHTSDSNTCSDWLQRHPSAAIRVHSLG